MNTILPQTKNFSFLLFLFLIFYFFRFELFPSLLFCANCFETFHAFFSVEEHLCTVSHCIFQLWQSLHFAYSFYHLLTKNNKYLSNFWLQICYSSFWKEDLFHFYYFFFYRHVETLRPNHPTLLTKIWNLLWNS